MNSKLQTTSNSSKVQCNGTRHDVIEFGKKYCRATLQLLLNQFNLANSY